MTTQTKDTIGPAMEGPIAAWYAAMTRSRGHGEDAARVVTASLPAGSAVLEVAPGPGYLAIHLAKLGCYTITGLDISQSFVQIAQKNAAAAGVSIDFRHGSASRMPFADETFDGLVCQAAFKNFGDPVGALNEMHRVLRPGGRAFILDMRGDATAAELDEAASQVSPNRGTQIVTKLIFKYSLVKRAYTRQTFQQLAARSRFQTARIETDLIGITVTLTKDKRPGA